MSEGLRGAVAALLSSRELVINIGSEDGVVKGMRFAVLYRQGLDIRDPETRKSLGSVEVPKVIVEAARVEEHLTVARTFTKRRHNVGGGGLDVSSTLGRMFAPAQWVEEWETLRTEEKPQAEELAEEQSYVKVGDPVVQVLDDDYITVDAT